MSTKSGFPLKNPPSQKAVRDELPRNNNQVLGNISVDRDDRGVRQGGKEGLIVIYMRLRCRQCNEEQCITFAWWKPPKWHRCVGCKELQPTQGYAMIAHSNQPLG